MKRIVLALAVLATPLAAQEPRTGHDDHKMAGMRHMEHMDGMMAPMMGGMAFMPDHILARKDSLQLTAAQVSSLTSLQDAAKKAHEDCAAAVKPHMEAIAQALRASAADTAALKPHFEAAHAAMGKGHWAMLAIAMRARGVLNEEQRARVERWASHKSEHGADHH